MHRPHSTPLGRSVRPLSREGPEKMQDFVMGHGPFFVLVAVMLGQFLLLSYQITRSHNVRLIKVWTVAIMRPFQYSVGGMVDSTARAWTNLRNLRSAQKQNQQLLAELMAARYQIQQLSERAAEAGRLRALLDFKARLPFPTLAAEVIASSPGEGSNAVFIDKGSKSGLTTDLAVIAPTGIVGKIIAVFPSTAQVLLITDPSSGVGCILEKSRVQGVLKGDNRNLCQLHYVMNEESVSAGDAVLTSGMDQIYPKDLPLGTVVEAREGNIYKTIIVKPTAALDRLETVLVALKPAAPEERPSSGVTAHPRDRK
jgi:rod shape-determining protein MreC